jgi:hypothetical protein
MKYEIEKKNQFKKFTKVKKITIEKIRIKSNMKKNRG